MNYSVELLTSKPDCQALIDIASSEKDGLSYRKTGMERQREAAASTSVQIETELVSVTAELAALQTVMDNLPEGPIKQDTYVKFRKAEFKKFLLEQRKENHGVFALLGKEHNIAQVASDIDETDAFIGAITERMNALGS